MDYGPALYVCTVSKSPLDLSNTTLDVREGASRSCCTLLAPMQLLQLLTTGSTGTQVEEGGEQKVCRNARGLWGGRAGCSALLCVGCLLLRAVWLQCCWRDCSEGTVGGTFSWWHSLILNVGGREALSIHVGRIFGRSHNCSSFC